MRPFLVVVNKMVNKNKYKVKKPNMSRIYKDNLS